MKKFLIVLAIALFVFMGCSNPAGGIDDSPLARLQGKWYTHGNFGPSANRYFEFSGNTIRLYDNNRDIDMSGSFTCTETVITATLPRDYTNIGLGYITHTIPYTITEETIWEVTYPNVLIFDKSNTWDPGRESLFIKLDTPPPPRN